MDGVGADVELSKKKGLSREEKIRRGVLKGDLEFLRAEFADSSLDVDWTDQNDATYVHHACFKGNLEVLVFCFFSQIPQIVVVDCRIFCRCLSFLWRKEHKSTWWTQTDVRHCTTRHSWAGGSVCSTSSRRGRKWA